MDFIERVKRTNGGDTIQVRFSGPYHGSLIHRRMIARALSVALPGIDFARYTSRSSRWDLELNEGELDPVTADWPSLIVGDFNRLIRMASRTTDFVDDIRPAPGDEGPHVHYVYCRYEVSSTELELAMTVPGVRNAAKLKGKGVLGRTVIAVLLSDPDADIEAIYADIRRVLAINL